jgi:hypothetical protein
MAEKLTNLLAVVGLIEWRVVWPTMASLAISDAPAIPL